MKKKEAMEALKPYLVAGPHPGGDWDAHCPLHDDTKRSARINFDKGLWICYAGCGKGKLSSLVRRLNPLRSQQDSGNPSSKEALQWHEALLADPDALEFLWATRYLLLGTIKRFQIGWDEKVQAYTIPIYLKDGRLLNVRKYRPNAPSDKKIWWAHKKNPNDPLPLYPSDVLGDTNWVVIAEGEMDALVALQHGIPAVTGTAGAAVWTVEWSKQFRGKWVFIAYDRDTSGERGTKVVAESLEPYADRIHVVTIPIDRKGADISDFFLAGKDADDFKALLRASPQYTKRTEDPTKEKAIKVGVLESFDAQKVGRGVFMDVHIAGRHNPPFSLPKAVKSECTMDAGPKCNVCPMLGRDGEYTFEVPSWHPVNLQMASGTKQVQHDALRQYIEAVKCDRLRHNIQSYRSVEELFVRPSWDIDTSDFTNRKVYGIGKHDTLPSQIVRLTGTTWPDPREQRNEFLAWDIGTVESAIDEFRPTPEIVRELRQFAPGSRKPLEKLWDISGEMERSVTRIYGRRDLHMAIALVYHSLLAFPFMGQLEKRGWLDALIVGDTRTGKSVAAAKMAEHYGAGKLVNCEAATFAGVVGGLQQIGAGNREWTVTWGVIPMNDRRLVILDEVSGLTHEQIQQMSDIRSSGYIQLTKIHTEQAWARTRLLWLSNPRDESMDKYTYGIQAIPPLIGNREDIARFDFAMALTSQDVALRRIHQSHNLAEPKHSSEDCRRLVLWAWSRKPENVEWIGRAEHDVLAGAEWLGLQYAPDPPLIQGANVRIKVARLAVALAAATFSSDSSGKKLLIERKHVVGALKFLDGIYKRETFGYHRMSTRQHEQRRVAIASMDDAKRWLQRNPSLLNFLLSVEGGMFRREMLESMLNYRKEEANAIVNRLFAWGLVASNTNAIKIQPMLHQLLRELG